MRRLHEAALLALALVACSRDKHSRGEGYPSRSTLMRADLAVSPVPLDPLQASGWLEHIDDPAHEPGSREAEDVFVAVPLGARDARPVVVAVHGAGDHPGNACAEWNGVLGGFAFIVCPHGFPAGKDRYSWGSADDVAARAERALELVRGRYDRHVASGKAVYAGFSQGATLGPAAVKARPQLFGAVALVELGHTPVDLRGVVNALGAAGTGNVLIGCTSGGCDAWAKRAKSALEREGIAVRTVSTGNRGHVFDDALAKALAPHIPWLVGDDPRWKGIGVAVTHRWGPQP
jgi:poly(3-hydroxybutyrate) depolymerase